MEFLTVIDMPKSCCSCNMCNSNDECILQDEDANFKASDSWEELRKGCPLKEVPKKKTATLYSIGAWNSGYNACIDEILKEGDTNGKID